MWNEFKQFISRGNVLDLAVAVVMGTAFTAIVNSLVKDIIMPIIGVMMGGLDFSALNVTVNSAAILFGSFTQAIVNFVIIAVAMFFVVKGANSIVKKKEAAPPPPPKPTAEETLLAEIRDLLKERSQRV